MRVHIIEGGYIYERRGKGGQRSLHIPIYEGGYIYKR